MAAGTSRGRADEPELGSSRMTRPTTSANASTATTTAEVRWVVIDIAKRTHAPIRRRRRSAIGPSAARLRKDRATTLRLVRLSRPLVTAVELPTTRTWPYHDGSQVKASRFRSPRCCPPPGNGRSNQVKGPLDPIRTVASVSSCAAQRPASGRVSALCTEPATPRLGSHLPSSACGSARAGEGMAAVPPTHAGPGRLSHPSSNFAIGVGRERCRALFHSIDLSRR